MISYLAICAKLLRTTSHPHMNQSVLSLGTTRQPSSASIAAVDNFTINHQNQHSPVTCQSLMCCATGWTGGMFLPQNGRFGRFNGDNWPYFSDPLILSRVVKPSLKVPVTRSGEGTIPSVTMRLVDFCLFLAAGVGRATLSFNCGVCPVNSLEAASDPSIALP
ncbi:hypothetical protein J6590_060082 [Homalodisca vitripennis]|nr:hypothetical protein J6590_060082 [Homalodisca vitripennis]